MGALRHSIADQQQQIAHLLGGGREGGGRRGKEEEEVQRVLGVTLRIQIDKDTVNCSPLRLLSHLPIIIHNNSAPSRGAPDQG